MRKLLALVGMVLLCTLGFADEIRLIEPGEFHGSDVETIHVVDNELWLGLFPRGEQYFWHKVVVRSKLSHDELVDDEGVDTGRTFAAVSGTAVPLFLIRGLDRLASNEVTTLKRDTLLDNGSSVPITLNGVEYRIEVTNSKTKEKVIGAGSKIVLVRGDTQQDLFALSGNANEPDWRLIWAGDLDGDGKLDFYVDLSDHYNVAHKRLFLSSQAEPGKLVKQVAEFVTTGC